MRRELHGSSGREMATADPSAMNEGLMSTLGVGWPNANGADTASGLRDSPYKVDVDTELATSPPPPPNVRACTLPFLGRIQVCPKLDSSRYLGYYGRGLTILGILWPLIYLAVALFEVILQFRGIYS